MARAPFFECADMWGLSPYALCSFRCTFCSAHAQGRSTPLFSREDLAARIRDEGAMAKSELPLVIGLIADPYPPEEARCGLTRCAIEVLTEMGRHFVIVTKGRLVIRDIDLLAGNPCAEEVLISLCSHEDEHLAVHEPGAAGFEERRRAAFELRAAGIRTRINVAPWIPGLTDVRALADAFLPGVPLYVGPLDLQDDLPAGFGRSPAARAFGDGLSQRDIDRAYLREAATLHGLAAWAFPVGARAHCAARMSSRDIERLAAELT